MSKVALVVVLAALGLSPVMADSHSTLAAVRVQDDATKYRDAALALCLSRAFADKAPLVANDAANTASTLNALNSSAEPFWQHNGQLSQLLNSYLQQPFRLPEQERQPLLVATCMDFYHSQSLADLTRAALSTHPSKAQP
ncbi:T6SS amidase immunity protein Tai4 family protein [Pokkaliibacter sp. MBI-7]|uniref:T6SS amidase immunity protein Tai4 family protein n=1 Tax=Pokkaliibacter sp. MBI-7 TaxID=3040600 RepID=UPI00244A3F51|nr:T6SS amidase immunity protein Tai4 family protein [Pokkaliibacter sp. MBI-7]MDH2433199.1 T6SS amidase immunity protein Tai4 family protein [Pokkaliibacter sp. MBI-7]